MGRVSRTWEYVKDALALPIMGLVYLPAGAFSNLTVAGYPHWLWGQPVTPPPTPPGITPEELAEQYPPGVYIDGNWGQYASARLITLAKIWGWEPRADAKDGHRLADLKLEECSYPGVDHNLTADDEEHIIWTSEIVEEWLNEHRRPEGLTWQWYDGEFGLWADEDDDDL